MSQKQQRTWWWIFVLSILWVWILWLVISVIFWVLWLWGISWWWDTLLGVIKAFINRILGLISLFSLIIGIPLGLIWLIKWYRDTNYNPNIKLKNKLDNIYSSDFDISTLDKNDLNEIKKHDFTKTYSVWMAVFLNIITLWIFWFFYYGFKHDRLPKIKENDFWSGQAIWFMFIPFFNIYWHFVFLLKLVNRINLQYRIRNENVPISKWLVIATLILDFIPYVNFISFFILHSIIISKIQSSINKLVGK